MIAGIFILGGFLFPLCFIPTTSSLIFPHYVFVFILDGFLFLFHLIPTTFNLIDALYVCARCGFFSLNACALASDLCCFTFVLNVVPGW